MIFCGTVSNGKRCPDMVSRRNNSQSLLPTLMASINCPGVYRRLVAARWSAALGKWSQYCVIIFRALVWRAPKTRAQHGSSTAEEREGDGSRLLAATQDIQHPIHQLRGLTGTSITSVGNAADQEKTFWVSFIHSSHTTAKHVEQLVMIKQWQATCTFICSQRDHCQVTTVGPLLTNVICARSHFVT